MLCVQVYKINNLKSALPKDAKPLCLIFYADKSKLSSFGTQQGYPVIARCANLPADIRNGRGVGGGRIVGLLPIVRHHFDNLYNLLR